MAGVGSVLELQVEPAQLQAKLMESGADGWVVIDFRGRNPVFADLMGANPAVSRRVFIVIRTEGEPVIVAHSVDAFLFKPEQTLFYKTSQELEEIFRKLFPGEKNILVEYSPMGALPIVSSMDLGTAEFLKSIGFTLSSSANIHQSLFATWSKEEAAESKKAADILFETMQSGLSLIQNNLGNITEGEVVEHIIAKLAQEGLDYVEAPDVAVNEHTALLHYVPTGLGKQIVAGDWILLDFIAARTGKPVADITWMAYAGKEPPKRMQRAFDLVVQARDLAVDFIQERLKNGDPIEAWEADRVARDFFAANDCADAFSHRLGHSLGVRGHGKGANLDNYEVKDFRKLLPGSAFTIEPGLYYEDFGVRSEINLWIGDDGLHITTPLQREIQLLG